MDLQALRDIIDARIVAGDTDAEIRTWGLTAVTTHRKLTLEALFNALIDQGTLGAIQTAAGEAQRKLSLDPAGTPTGTESAALQAVSLMRGAQRYGRETVNWSKAAHLAALDALETAGLLTEAQRDAVYDAATVTTETPFSPLGDVPSLQQIANARAL